MTRARLAVGSTLEDSGIEANARHRSVVKGRVEAES
jgi:hypothetical protein